MLAPLQSSQRETETRDAGLAWAKSQGKSRKWVIYNLPTCPVVRATAVLENRSSKSNVLILLTFWKLLCITHLAWIWGQVWITWWRSQAFPLSTFESPVLGRAARKSRWGGCHLGTFSFWLQRCTINSRSFHPLQVTPCPQQSLSWPSPS